MIEAWTENYGLVFGQKFSNYDNIIPVDDYALSAII